MLNAQKADELKMLSGRLYALLNDIGADDVSTAKGIIEEHLAGLRKKEAVATRAKLTVSI